MPTLVPGTAQTGRKRVLTEMLFCSNARQSFGGSRRFHPPGFSRFIKSFGRIDGRARQGAVHAANRYRHRGRRARRLDRGRDARAGRHRRDPDRFPQGLSVRFPLREARRLAGRPGAQDRACRRDPARRNGRRRGVDRALRAPDREAAEPAIRHSLRRAGQHDPRRPAAVDRVHPRQGRGDRDRRGAAERHPGERRRDFRAADRDGERAQYRPASHARHDPRGGEHLPLDQRRLRRAAARPRRASTSAR